MSTCFGATCLNMDDLYNFITGIKDLDLYGWSHKKCCDGEEIDGNCNCEDDDDKNDDLCMFSYCWSWNDLFARLSWAEGELNTNNTTTAWKWWNNLTFDGVAALFGSAIWSGSLGQDAFKDRKVGFWTRFGQIVEIAVSILSAAVAGVTLVTTGSLIGAWADNNEYVGALFLNYSNNDIIKTTIGILGSIWTIIPLVLVADMVYSPIYLAQEMDKAFNENAADKTKQDVHMLGMSFLVAFGSFLGASSIAQGTGIISNFFDLNGTAAINNYKNKFVTGDDETKKNAAGAFEVDLFHHTIISFFYYLVGACISNGAYFYVLNSVQKFAVANQ